MDNFQIGDVPYHITLWADLFTAAWLLGMIYTTKFWMDLMDSQPGDEYWCPDLVCVITPSGSWSAGDRADGVGSIFGLSCIFVFNFHPASIFWERAEAHFGVHARILAIISGGKIATALLILGIPILDVAWVILRRVVQRTSPFGLTANIFTIVCWMRVLAIVRRCSPFMFSPLFWGKFARSSKGTEGFGARDCGGRDGTPCGLGYMALPSSGIDRVAEVAYPLKQITF